MAVNYQHVTRNFKSTIETKLVCFCACLSKVFACGDNFIDSYLEFQTRIDLDISEW